LAVATIPGDPEQVRRLSARLATVETRAQEIQSRLRAIETGIGPQIWRGQAADGFTALLAETGPDLTTLAASYGMASQALATYATELAAAQVAARAAQAEASTASADRDRATADHDSAGSDADRHASAASEAQLRLDPGGAQAAELRRADALQRANAAQAAADQAQQAFQAAQRKVDEAANQRDAAAARCIAKLEEASRAGIDIRNLTQPPTAGGAPQSVTAGADTVGLRSLGSGTVEPAAADGIEDDTGAVLAGAAFASVGHRVLGPAATSIVQSFAGAPGPIPPPPVNTTVAGNAAWWRGLDAAQREQVLRQHPEWVGNRDGIPAADRDKANRVLLDREIARVDRELAAANARLDAVLNEKLPPGMEGQGETRDQIQFRQEVERLTEQRDALAAVTRAIDPKGRQLLHLDVSGHAQPRAAVAVGTVDATGNVIGVDTADHVAVFTPGFTTTVAGSLEGYVNDMQALQKQSRDQLAVALRGTESVAAVAWLGYDAPQWDTLGDYDQSVLIDAAAQRGGTELAGFLDGILASRPDDLHLTALGHSYGSTTTGYALQQVDGVDDAVLFGSPGAATSDIADLRVPPGHISVLEARGDFVADLGSFGGDTNQLDGVTNLSAREETAPDGTVLRESKDHSEYLVPGTTSQHNIAATVAGLPDLRITGPNIGLGDVLRETWDAF
jgi:uncharacterized protein YukE